MNETKSDRPEPPKIPQKPAPGPGVTTWLSSLIGPAARVRRESPPVQGLVSDTAIRVPVELPDSLFNGAEGTLRRLSTRALPAGIVLSAGRKEADGHWVLTPAEAARLTAIVDNPATLPLAVTFKAEFESSDGGETWTEMMGAVIDAEKAIAPRTAEDASPAKPAAPDVLSVIGLEVSLGIDDPAAVMGVVLHFAGLPPGALLTAGEAGADGAWRVPAPDLGDIAVMVPDDAPPFDLTVAIDGDPEQAASFRVDTPAERRAATLRLGAPTPAVPLRFRIFADGAQIADRVVRWANASSLPVELSIPDADETAPPYEIVVRYGALEQVPEEGPVFMGAVVGSVSIAPDAPCISARGGRTDTGRRWSGDFVIDVRNALQEEVPEPSVATEPIADMPPKPTPPHPAGDEEASAPHLSFPMTSATPAVSESGDETETPTLVLCAAADDIRRPAFIQELERLGRFIREPEGEVDHRLYDRLGIDVGRWHDIAIYGPAGEPVETSPMLPALAPPGGRDNARGFSHLDRWYTPQPGVRTVLVEGLPPGGMLSHGINLGDGRWRVSADDIPRVSVVGPMGERTTVPAVIVELDENDRPLNDRMHALLMGTVADTLRPRATGLLEMRMALAADVFDPDGHGTLSLTIGDMPAGSLVCGASNHGGGVWTLDTTTGSDLSIMASAQSEAFAFTLTCIALDTTTGDSSVVTRTLRAVPRRGAIDGVAA